MILAVAETLRKIIVRQPHIPHSIANTSTVRGGTGTRDRVMPPRPLMPLTLKDCHRPGECARYLARMWPGICPLIPRLSRPRARATVTPRTIAVYRVARRSTRFASLGRFALALNSMSMHAACLRSTTTELNVEL